MTNQQDSQREPPDRSGGWWRLLLLTVLFLTTTGWNLHVQSIENPDEPRYASAVREMMRGGDPLIPIFDGEARLQKPILYYWLSVFTGWFGERIGIPIETALRLEPLVMGLITVCGTYCLASRFFSSNTAFLSACVLISASMFHSLSRELLTDMTLTAFLTWFTVFFLAGVKRWESSRSPLPCYLSAYICAGLACLTKGPVLLGVFVFLPLIVWIILLRRAKNPIPTGIWWGVPLSLLTGLWWYVAVIKANQQSTFFFSPDSLQRFTASKGHEHLIPYLYYLINLGESFAPWSLFVPVGVWWTAHKLKRNKLPLSAGALLALCLGLVPFFVLGMATAKRHLYLLPLYPLLAVWMGWLFDEACQAWREERLSKMWPAVGLASAVSLALALFSTPLWLSQVGGVKSEFQLCVTAGAAVLALAVFAWFQLRRGLIYSASLIALGISLLLPVIYEGTFRPIRERKLALKDFYRDVRRYAAGRSLIFNGLNANEAVWYLDQNSEKIQEISLLEMPDQFFGKTERRMLAPVMTLHEASLDEAVIRHSPALCRYGENFVVVSPKPGVVVTQEQMNAARGARTSKRQHGILHGL